MNPSRSIEGISEYRLPNGLQILLIPDPSKSIVTLNMTVFVGSRHEGYGEAGMAHLLEHMLFKGTPTHTNIPELMRQRGASFNGTTWLDRTNYYETLPATTQQQAAENLEFAIALESDRLVNSTISGEDLASEMTVVRNEFERGENNSRRILSQRVHSIAFDWHNYGRSTIGNLSDIERMPVEGLQRFYRKFYRPDNAMVVVAGSFDTEHALQTIERYYGAIATPETPLDRTYTLEPAQDGERSVTLRRVGNTQYVSSTYHVPCGASREFAAVELLAYIFGTEPTGRLYQDLVVTELAANTSTSCYGLHDPGIAKFEAQVPVGKPLEAARDVLLRCAEQVASKPISQEELNRARSQFLKSRQLRAADCTTIAVELSDWAAQGDWRLYFLFRDYVESITPAECTEVASRYFNRNNRTLGMFIPSESAERVAIPARPDLGELLENYQGRADQTQGEIFDSSPAAIEARTVRGRLTGGLHTAILQKKTRGNSVNLELNLRYGNEAALAGLTEAADFLPELMQRGTQNRSYEQLQDRFDELRADVRSSGSNCLLNLSIETTRENLDPVLEVVDELLRYPKLDPQELEMLRRQAIASTESRMSEPNVLASIALRRALAPFEPSNVRYVPTLEERIERYQSLQVGQLKQLHETLLNGQNGEVAVVGDCGGLDLNSKFEAMFSNWKNSEQYLRIDQPAQHQLPASMHEILTPEKANAVYYAGMHLPIRDDDLRYPALLIGNYILGGSALTSRLGDRVRQQEGLSYSVGSSLSAHPIDHRMNITIYAIFSPSKRAVLSQAIREELDRWMNDGPTAAELDAAITGFLQSEQLQRSSDDNIAGLLVSSTFAKRDLSYYVEFERRIAELTVDQVVDAYRQFVDFDRLIQVYAGDF